MRPLRLLAVASFAVLVTGCASQPFVFSGPNGLFVSVPLDTAATNIITGAAMVGILVAGNGYRLDDAPMRADRTVHEQDCTKPIENPGANLRCK